MSAELEGPNVALRFSSSVRSAPGGNVLLLRNPSADSSIHEGAAAAINNPLPRLASNDGSRDDLAQLVQPFKRRTCLLQFEDPMTERGFAKHLASTYPFRAPIGVSALFASQLSSWVIFGLLIRDSALTWAEATLHLIGALGVCAILVNLFTASHDLCGLGPEAWAYASLLPLLTVWIIWFFSLLLQTSHGENVLHHGLEEDDHKVVRHYIDSIMLLLVLVFALVYDQILATRTRLSLIPHVLLMGISAAFAFELIYSARHGVTTGLEVALEWIQVLFNVCIIVFAYLGRGQTEKSERLTFLASQADRIRVERLRLRHLNRRKARGETLIETLIYRLKRAQLSLQKAAFERQRTGDPQILEADEILRYCNEALLSADTFGRVGDTDCVTDDHDTQMELRYVQLLAGKGFGSLELQTEHCTGEDLTANPDREPATTFWTSERMHSPKLSGDSLAAVGRDPSLPMLELAARYDKILVEVGCALLTPYLDILGIPEVTLRRYLCQVEARYFPNPYHSAVHGAMVAHMFTVIVGLLDCFRSTGTSGGGVSGLRDLDMAACTLGCLAHDVGHPGRNNAFHMNLRSVIATIYGEKAILERYHAFLCFRFALISSEVNIFQNLTNQQYQSVKELIIQAILDTDMSCHFSAISKFRVRRNAEDFDSNTNQADIRMILRMTVKLADLSHGIISWREHQLWSYRVVSEFYQQGLDEEQLGLPQSPMCNVWEHAKFAKSQAGFLEYVVTPLAEELQTLDHSGNYNNEILTRLCYNRYRWSALNRAGTKLAVPTEILMEKLPHIDIADRMWLLAVRSRSVRDLNTKLTAVQSIALDQYPKPVNDEPKESLPLLLERVLAALPEPVKRVPQDQPAPSPPSPIRSSYQNCDRDYCLSPAPPPPLPVQVWPGTPSDIASLRSSPNRSSKQLPMRSSHARNASPSSPRLTAGARGRAYTTAGSDARPRRQTESMQIHPLVKSTGYISCDE